MIKKISQFRDLPKNARRYILLHTIGSPLMVGDYIIIIYLLLTGYDIIGVGTLFTIINIIEIFFPVIFGRLFERKISAKIAMSFIYSLEGLAYLLFYFAYGSTGWIFLTLGVFTMKFATVFYPIFPAYEHYVYPENIREKAMLYHLMVPEYAQIITFPIFGFVLTFIFTDVSSYRTFLLLLSAGSFLILPYLFYAIEDIRTTKIEVEKEDFKIWVPSEFIKLLLIEDFLILAESMLPLITITYFIIFILNQSFFILMLLEVTNSAVTIISGQYLKNKEFKKRYLLIGGVLLFALVNVFYILAAWRMSIVPLIIAVILQTLGNVFWFPVHRTMLFNTIPKERRGTFFGSMSTTFRLSTAIAPFISTLLISLWVYLPFAVAGVLYFMAGIGYYFLTKSWK